MNAESIVAVAAGVVAVTQLIKWAGMKDSFGPLVVIILSGIGVFVWLFSQQDWPPVRTDTWNIASGWITVTLSAAGTFGFTRAAASAVSSATSPPAGGAGSSATVPSSGVPRVPTPRLTPRPIPAPEPPYDEYEDDPYERALATLRAEEARKRRGGWESEIARREYEEAMASARAADAEDAQKQKRRERDARRRRATPLTEPVVERPTRRQD